MVNMIEVLKQALEAFEIAAEGGGVNFHAYAEELRQAIKELESQEPVAWRWKTHNGYAYSEQHYEGEDGQPLYTHPPQRTWVRLTDEVIKTICSENGWDSSWQSLRFARAIEAKLKERNG